MKNIKFTSNEIRTLELFLWANPCTSGCAYPEMQKSSKNCNECKLTKDKYNIIKKLDLI